MATNKKTVLITGASAGIGAAFADVFARNQWDLVLTARREDRLKDLADKLRTQHGCDVETIQADLAKPEAPQHIFDQLQANNTKLQGLVNNAGYGVPGYYTGTPWQQQQDFIQVLVTAVAHLCHLFLPHMVEQGYGRIINVSSINGLLPCSPGQTLYSGAKSFVVGLSQTLHAEAGKHGVHVNALCPGLTYTEFHDVTGTREMVNRVPKSQWSTAEEVAAQGYQAVMRGDLLCVPGRSSKVAALAAKFLPNSLMVKMMTEQSKKIRRSD